MFKGSLVALITPFNKEGKLDALSLKNLIRWHIKNGTQGLVLCGTTGEAPTLLEKEKLKIFESAVSLAKGKIPIIAGTGSYSTKVSKELTLEAKKIGVDAALVVVPYYNKPEPAGLIKHFEQIASVNLPIILYYHPGRTGLKISLNTFQKLQNIKQIVAVKDAYADLSFTKQLLENTSFDIFSGEDNLTIEMIKLGAKGTISVVANVIPFEFQQICKYALDKKFDEAQVIYEKMKELFQVMTLETNPQCVKYALSQMNFCSEFIRLPLTEPTIENQKIIKRALINVSQKIKEKVLV